MSTDVVVNLGDMLHSQTPTNDNNTVAPRWNAEDAAFVVEMDITEMRDPPPAFAENATSNAGEQRPIISFHAAILMRKVPFLGSTRAPRWFEYLDPRRLRARSGSKHQKEQFHDCERYDRIRFETSQ